MVIKPMLSGKKLVIILVLLIFLVGCNVGANDNGTIRVSEMIGNEEAEIAGNSYDMHLDSIVNYKYDGENLVERSEANGKNIYYYDGGLKSKIEKYSQDRLIATTFYTYDNNGKEIKRETVREKTKEKSYYITSYEDNYKEVSYYNTNDELSRVIKHELNEKQQVVKSISKANNNWEYEKSHEYEDDRRIFTHTIETGITSITRKIYYKYNEYGDRVSLIKISFGDTNSLEATYYYNEYEDLKLVKQITYLLYAEIDEETAKDIVKSLK